MPPTLTMLTLRLFKGQSGFVMKNFDLDKGFKKRKIFWLLCETFTWSLNNFSSNCDCLIWYKVIYSIFKLRKFKSISRLSIKIMNSVSKSKFCNKKNTLTFEWLWKMTSRSTFLRSVADFRSIFPLKVPSKRLFCQKLR